MKVNEIITESATSIVYHFTPVGNALNIIKTDEFILGASEGSDKELNRGRQYYMSVARVPYGDYQVGENSGVIFVMDGRRWSAKHKVIPVSFYGGEYRGKNESEYEERLLSNESTLPVNGCIKEVHILSASDRHRNSQVRKLVILCRHKGIPVFVYRNKRAWKILDTNNAVPSHLLAAILTGNQKVDRTQTKELDSPCKPLAELIWKKDEGELSPTATQLLIAVRNEDNSHAPKLTTERLVSQSSGVPERKRSGTYDRIIAFMRKNKIQDIEALCQYLHEKWDTK